MSAVLPIPTMLPGLAFVAAFVVAGQPRHELLGVAVDDLGDEVICL